jgi:hypothetical protein
VIAAAHRAWPRDKRARNGNTAQHFNGKFSRAHRSTCAKCNNATPSLRVDIAALSGDRRASCDSLTQATTQEMPAAP